MWAVEVAFAAYAILITGMLLLERRRPTATLAWIFALVFLPVLGLAAYLLVGRNRVRRRRRRRARRRVNAVDATRHLANVEALPENLTVAQRGLVDLALKTATAPLRRADRVELLSTGEHAAAALREAIATAHRYIHMEFYIWTDDESGREVTALLTERARAGVTVRVVYDHVGSLGLPPAHFDALRAAGGQVAIFGRLRIPFRIGRSRVNFRNHRKIVVVDDTVGFVGGLNVGDPYLQADARTQWRDLQIRIDGDALVGLGAVFLEDWMAATGEVVDLDGVRAEGTEGRDGRLPDPGRVLPGLRRRMRRRAITSGQDPFTPQPDRPATSSGPLLQIVPSGPDTLVADAIATQFTAAIASARDRVWMATPYFIPDESLAIILRTAALRGVDLRILVPDPVRSDQRLVATASRSYYDDLMDAGCRIFEYESGMLHAKYLIVDDTVCAVGSANMDVRSFHINYEISAMIYDEGTTTQLSQLFEEDLAGAREVNAHSRANLPLSGRLAEGFARVLSPLL